MHKHGNKALNNGILYLYNEMVPFGIFWVHLVDEES